MTPSEKAHIQECVKELIEKHRHHLVNYELLQTEYHISIGSGAVESAIKQIDRRLKILGARREASPLGQWNSISVTPMLRLRCAYLNGLKQEIKEKSLGFE